MINFHSNALLSPLSRLHCPSHMPVTYDRSASRAWCLVLRITRFPLDFPTGRGSAVTPPKSSTVYMSCHVVILPFIFLHYGNPTLTYSLSFSKWLRRHYGIISSYKINARVIWSILSMLVFEWPIVYKRQTPPTAPDVLNPNKAPCSGEYRATMVKDTGVRMPVTMTMSSENIS